MSRYGKVSYWNERYSFKNECYEWFEDYDGVKHLLTADMLSPANGVSTSRPRRTIQVRDREGNLVPRSIVCLDESPRLLTPTLFPCRETSRVLILGCGNSAFGECMLQDGWTGGITQVDFSDVVIEQMKERYDETFYKEISSYKNAAGSTSSNNKTIPPMEFVCADVTKNLPFEDGSFDVIVCKGTLDAILSSAGSIASAKDMMYECCRLLADHGALVVVSHASPDNRLVFFENCGDEWWAGLNVHHLHKDRKTSESPGASDVYVYNCRKRTGGGKTRLLCSIADSVAPLVRSTSNEENEQVVEDAKTSSVKKLPAPRDDTNETSRALVQVQVPVA